MSKASEQTPSNDPPATAQAEADPQSWVMSGVATNRRSSAKEFSIVVGRCLRALRELKSPVQQRLALEFIIDDLRLPKPKRGLLIGDQEESS